MSEHTPTHPLDMEARFAARWAGTSGDGATPPAGGKTESDAGVSGIATRADGTAQATENRSSSPVAEPTLPVPENIAALRKSAPIEDRIYGTSGYKHIPFDFGPDVQPATAKAMRGEFHRMLADVGVSPGDGETLANVVRAGFANPPDAATREAWKAQVAESDRSEAAALVARDPRARELVTRSFAIEHPRVVQILAERARAERARGRL